MSEQYRAFDMCYKEILCFQDVRHYSSSSMLGSGMSFSRLAQQSYS